MFDLDSEDFGEPLAFYFLKILKLITFSRKPEKVLDYLQNILF